MCKTKQKCSNDRCIISSHYYLNSITMIVYMNYNFITLDYNLLNDDDYCCYLK